jgi:hypothetical protein
MTKKTAKSGAAPKRTRTVMATRKRVVPARDAMTEAQNGNFWTLRLEPMELYVVGDNVPMSLMIIKNLGQDVVGVYAGYGDQKDLAPGKLRVTTAYAKITVENKAEKPALLAMQIQPE